MRKHYKNKKRSCGLCKPHKRGWSKRSEGDIARRKEEARLEDLDRELDSLLDWDIEDEI